MRKSLFIAAVLLVCFSQFAHAVSGSVTYALKVGDSFASGTAIDVNDGEGKLAATITYGETGGAEFAAAIADAHLTSFPAYTTGNGTNGNNAGGTFYTIVPKYNGTVEVAVVINSGKKFYITEDGTALDEYDGITVDEKFYGMYSFAVEGGKTYRVYCAGSKLGFYGFQYAWDDNGEETPGDDPVNPGGEEEEDLGIGTGTIRYASPTGTSSTGLTPEAPGKLTTMISKLAAGDILYLLDGQYDFSSSISINKSGTANKYILIAAYKDAKPILDFRKQPNGNGYNGIKVGGSYLYIKGITVRYAGYKGIWLEGCQYNILENLDVYGCCNAGIQLRSGGHNLVLNCDAHDNFDYQDKGGNADGFADKQGDACPGNIYIGCRSWNNSDDGWDSYGRVTSGTPTVYINCIAYNNGPATFDLSKNPRVNGVDKNLSCFSGKTLSKFANGGNPNGFKVGGNGTKHNVELYRCIAIGHRKKGFDQNNNAGKMKIVNCTAYQNNTNYGFGNNYAYTLYLYNNISLSPTGGTSSSYHLSTSSSGTVFQSNNSWTSSAYAVTNDYFESTDINDMLGEVDEFGNQLLKPRNDDGSLPDIPLLKLKDTAKNAIDRGRNFTDFEGERIAKYIFFHGDAPDLGCFELEQEEVVWLIGDVNEDSKVDISDIVAVINQIAGTATYRYADVNDDNKVDISDIVAIINVIANQE